VSAAEGLGESVSAKLLGELEGDASIEATAAGDGLNDAAVQAVDTNAMTATAPRKNRLLRNPTPRSTRSPSALNPP